MTTTNSPYLAEERDDDDPVLRASDNVVNAADLLSAPLAAPLAGGFWNDVGVLMGVGPDLTQSISTAVDTLATASTNKLILSSINHGTATYTRNASCWITADKTCIAVWNSRSNAQAYSGCAISPRHILLALHTGIQVGDTFRFLTNGNLVVTRTISSLATVSGDLQIGKLDSDLPSTITPAKVLPADFTAFLQFSTTLPLVCVDQESKMLVRDWTAYTAPDATHTNSIAAVRLPLTETIISGDSGAPLFVLVGGELVLLGTHFQPNVFPAISSIVVAANAAMTSLGGGNQLSQINLSGYTPIAVRSAVGHTHDLKTINNQSIKGTGNISISGTGGEILANGTVPFTANQPLAGFRFTGLGTPTPRSNDAARSIDVFNHVNVFFKRIYNVRAVDSNNVDLTVPVTTINGIALQAGDYVLIANQTAPSQNGLYIFTDMVSLLTRFSSDFDDLINISVSVLDGVTLGKTRWINTNVVGGTLGVTAVTFARAYIPPAGPANSILVGAGVDARPLWATPATLGLVDTAAMQAALDALSVGAAAESWESIAKNLRSYDATITYSSGRVSTIAYADPGGTVTKTINYTGAKITSIVLSGAGLPSGIPLTKTLTYTGEDVTSVTYS